MGIDTTLTAVIVGERFIPRGRRYDSLYPNSSEIPFSLLPIAGVPIIDFLLQNLLHNQVDTVHILVNRVSYDLVYRHLAQNITSRGRPWMATTDMKISLIKATGYMRRLHDAAQEILSQNIVHTNAFLFVPIDCVFNIPNLKKMFLKHVIKSRKITGLAATAIFVTQPQDLNYTFQNTLHDALQLQGRGKSKENAATQIKSSGKQHVVSSRSGSYSRERQTEFSNHASNTSAHTKNYIFASPSGNSGCMTTPTGATGTGGRGGSCTDVAGTSTFSAISESPFPSQMINPLFHNHYVTALPANPHMTIAYQTEDTVVRHLTIHDSVDQDEAMTFSFSSKSRLTIRTDLFFTGLCFLATEALNLFVSDMSVEMTDFFIHMLVHEEINKNVFCVQIASPQSEIASISSLRHYLQANIDVLNRRFYPLTPDSGFAESVKSYTVSSHCNTVYVHTTHGTLLNKNCGPCVLIGKDVTITPDDRISNSVIGIGTTIKNNTSISGSVIVGNATIGANVRIINCFIGPEVTVSDGVEICNSIIGAYCVISPSSNSLEKGNLIDSMPNNIDKGHILSIRGCVMVSTVSEGEETMVTDIGGVGKILLHANPYPRSIWTKELFCNDFCQPPPNELTNDELSEDDWESFQIEVTEFIRSIVLEHTLTDELVINAYLNLTSLRFACQSTNDCLCHLVMEQLVKAIVEKYKEDSGEVQFSHCQEYFTVFFRHFFSKLLKKEEDMVTTLSGLCCAIRGTKLMAYVEEMLVFLYNECDEDSFEKQGYCLVTGEAILKMEEAGHRILKIEKSDRDYEEECILAVCRKCTNLFKGLKEFFSERTED